MTLQERNEKIIDLYLNSPELSNKEIAEIFNVSTSTISRIARINNLPRRSGNTGVRLTLEQEQEIVNLYLNSTPLIKLQENDILHVYLPYGKDDWDMDPGWYRIKVTYIRSGVVFFKYVDTKHKLKEDHADILSSFIKNAYIGTIRVKDVSIKECNIPLIKIERYKNDPYPVELINEDGITVAIL